MRNGCNYLLLWEENKEKDKERKREKARKQSPGGYHSHFRNSVLEKYGKMARDLKEENGREEKRLKG